MQSKIIINVACREEAPRLDAHPWARKAADQRRKEADKHNTAQPVEAVRLGLAQPARVSRQARAQMAVCSRPALNMLQVTDRCVCVCVCVRVCPSATLRMSKCSLVKVQTCVPGQQLQHLTVSSVESSEFKAGAPSWKLWHRFMQMSTEAPCTSSRSQLGPILCDARWKGAAVCHCNFYFDGNVAPLLAGT